MPREILVIDGNAVGFARHMSMPNLRAGDTYVGAVYGFMDFLREALIKYPRCQNCVVLWDGKAHWRYMLLSQYKSSRKKNPKQLKIRQAYKAQVPLIRNLLTPLGVNQWVPADYEADDLAGMYARKFGKDPDNRIILATSDKDWLQLVQPNVIWWDCRDGTVVTLDSFKDKTGYETPKQFSQSKLLTGDRGDDVPGVGGIGPENAQRLLTKFGSIHNAITHIRENPEDYPKAWRKLLTEEGMQRIRENSVLMDLTQDMSPAGLKRGTFIPGEFNEDKVKHEFACLYFNSFLSSFNVWISPFRR